MQGRILDPANMLSEKMLSDELLNSSRSMISIINRDYIYERVNRKFYDTCTCPESSIVGRSLEDIWGAETFRSKIKDKIDLCFSGETVKYEASFTTQLSGKRFFEVIFRPFTREKGEVTHLLAETFDITDLKLSEKLAQEKAEELRRFETNLPIGFVRCSPDGTILISNNAFRAITDCSESDLQCADHKCKANLRNFYTEPDLFYIHLNQLRDGKPRNFGRIPLKTCSDIEKVCRISAFMGFDAGSNPQYIDFSIEDSSRELMLENRLLQAQKLETIGALAGGIAHDFNNILSTISGYTELMQEDLTAGSQFNENLSRIQAAVQKARSLTGQILTFSRQVEQEKVKVDLCQVLNETIGFVQTIIPDNVIIDNQAKCNCASVFADPTQLFRVFLNLITNAAQALEGKAGSITVKVRIAEGEKVRSELNNPDLADEYAVVSVIDTGKGMDPSLMRRIFEPFFTTREVGKGTGLGLSVVHGIIMEMGGEILVSSRKGAGSEFMIYLPVDKSVKPKAEEESPGAKILFLSEGLHESKIISIALENSGYKVIPAEIKSSIGNFLTTPDIFPDLLVIMFESEQESIIDHSALNAIAGSKLPVILITDTVLTHNEEVITGSGLVNQHLIKPVSLKDLNNAIQIALT